MRVRGRRLGVAVGLLLLPATAQGQGNTVVVGRVVSENGEPLPNATVLVDGSDLGALTDEDGRFRIDGLPVGPQLVRVQTIAFAEAVQEVRLQPGDSAYLSFELRPVEIRLAGDGYPLPDSAYLATAQQLLPEVLDAFRADHPEWLAPNATVVWIPWATESGSTTAGVRFRNQCDGCWSRAVSTVEGGRRYRVETAHLRVGVYGGGPGQLTFCLDPGEPGDLLMVNCHGSGRTAVVRYMRLDDGRWLRVSR
ncbi:MAG: carboxypeptidase-like regulatory domain-containing protein [Phycisphaerales bacterium JB038]